MNFTAIELCIFFHMLIYIFILVSAIINIELLDKENNEWSEIIENTDAKEIQKIFVSGLLLSAIPIMNICILTVELYAIIDTIKNRKCENKDDI